MGGDLLHRYCIGNLITDIDCECKRLEKLGKAYESNSTNDADITFKISDSALNELEKKHPEMDRDGLAYFFSGSVFYRKASLFNAVMLHSSAIMYKGKGYLFSADSGVGKTTHTKLWQKVFGNEVKIINDDKPLIRKIDGQWMVFGTPWSGDSDENLNVSVPVGGIIFISRAQTNKIRRLELYKDEIAQLFLEQTIRAREPEQAMAVLENADDLLKSVPVFFLECNTSTDAVMTAYKAIIEE